MLRTHQQERCGQSGGKAETKFQKICKTQKRLPKSTKKLTALLKIEPTETEKCTTIAHIYISTHI